MLDPDQLQKIRLVLHTDGWNDVILPMVMNRGRLALKALALTPSERSREMKDTDYDTDDDVLRAMIRECQWMSLAWVNEIQVAEHNRRLDELEPHGEPVRMESRGG